jgi:hypothetical protein
MLTKEQIDKIETLNNSQNNGRGIICVGYIIKHLRNKDIPLAQKVFTANVDTLIRHPELYILLVDTIGCRCHGKENCQDGLCKDIYSELLREMALNQLDKKEFKDEK